MWAASKVMEAYVLDPGPFLFPSYCETVLTTSCGVVYASILDVKDRSSKAETYGGEGGLGRQAAIHYSLCLKKTLVWNERLILTEGADLASGIESSPFPCHTACDSRLVSDYLSCMLYAVRRF